MVDEYVVILLFCKKGPEGTSPLRRVHRVLCVKSYEWTMTMLCSMN